MPSLFSPIGRRRIGEYPGLSFPSRCTPPHSEIFHLCNKGVKRRNFLILEVELRPRAELLPPVYAATNKDRDHALGVLAQPRNQPFLPGRRERGGFPLLLLGKERALTRRCWTKRPVTFPHEGFFSFLRSRIPFRQLSPSWKNQ